MTTRNAQIQFGESLMVVIVLVFILIIGLVFYFRVSSVAVMDEQRYREDIMSVRLASSIPALSEIQCGQFTCKGDVCIDRLKMTSLATVLAPTGAYVAQREYYERLFGHATIKLHLVTGDDAGEEFTLYHDPPPADWSRARQYLFTTLCNPVTERQELAYLNVTRYMREVDG